MGVSALVDFRPHAIAIGKHFAFAKHRSAAGTVAHLLGASLRADQGCGTQHTLPAAMAAENPLLEPLFKAEQHAVETAARPDTIKHATYSHERNLLMSKFARKPLRRQDSCSAEAGIDEIQHRTAWTQLFLRHGVQRTGAGMQKVVGFFCFGVDVQQAGEDLTFMQRF